MASAWVSAHMISCCWLRATPGSNASSTFLEPSDLEQDTEIAPNLSLPQFAGRPREYTAEAWVHHKQPKAEVGTV